MSDNMYLSTKYALIPRCYSIILLLLEDCLENLGSNIQITDVLDAILIRK